MKQTGQKAFDEIEAMKSEKAADKMIFSESNKDGKFLPKQKDALISFVRSLSEKQRDQFSNLVTNLPKNSLFTEKGSAGAPVDTTAAARIDTAVKAKMKDTKMKYSEALKVVLSEDKSLAAEYQAEINEQN